MRNGILAAARVKLDGPVHSISCALKTGLKSGLITVSGENGALKHGATGTPVALKSGRPKKEHEAREINGWIENGGPKQATGTPECSVCAYNN